MSAIVERSLSRRRFLGLIATLPIAVSAGLFGLPDWLGISSQLPQSPDGSLIKTKSLELKSGRWALGQIEQLASEMVSETEYNDIAYIGNILQANLSGRPSLSVMTPMFSDQEISIITIPSGQPPFANSKTKAPTSSLFVNTSPKIEVKLKDRANGDQVFWQVPPSIELRELRVNQDIFRKHSTFLREFFITREMLAPVGFDLAATYLMNKDKSGLFDSLTDPNLKAAVKIGLLGREINGVQAYLLGYIWSYLLMVPNYCLAVDQGRVTEREINNELTAFKYAAQILKQKEALIKDPSGSYRWVDDRQKLEKSWLESAGQLYNKNQEFRVV